jgi:hypothetical protein
MKYRCDPAEGAAIPVRPPHCQALFFTVAFCLAHLRFCAAAIRARASGLSVRFFPGNFVGGVDPRPARIVRACWRREISESISEINWAVSMADSVYQCPFGQSRVLARHDNECHETSFHYHLCLLRSHLQFPSRGPTKPSRIEGKGLDERIALLPTIDIPTAQAFARLANLRAASGKWLSHSARSASTGLTPAARRAGR